MRVHIIGRSDLVPPASPWHRLAAVKLATWNVNSIRARLERVLGWLDTVRPDVVCLQETKVVDGDFPAAEVEALGYRLALHGQRTYNGVAILARGELSDVVAGFADGEPEEPQARLVAATTAGVRVASVYAPNGQAPGSEKFAAKLAFYARLERYVERALAAGVPLALCGDFNVAPEDRDVHDPAAWHEQIHCSTPEREALAAVVGRGLTDALRALRPEVPGLYTWWDYRMLGFQKNRGLRIDHILVAPALVPRLTDVAIDREARKGKQPSDHAPVVATLAD
jgi:exodeoxyribonuclease-3